MLFFLFVFLLLCFQHWKLFPHEIEPLWEHDAICDDNFRENLLKCIFASEWNSFQFAVDFNAAPAYCVVHRFAFNPLLFSSFYQICTIFIFNFHMCADISDGGLGVESHQTNVMSEREHRERCGKSKNRQSIQSSNAIWIDSEPPLMTWWFFPDFLYALVDKLKLIRFQSGSTINFKYSWASPAIVYSRLRIQNRGFFLFFLLFINFQLCFSTLRIG